MGFAYTTQDIKRFATELGVDRDSSPHDVSRAFRRAALRLHPDRHFGDKESEEKFKFIANIFSALGKDLGIWRIASRSLPLRLQPKIAGTEARRRFGFLVQKTDEWREPGLDQLMEDILAAVKAGKLLDQYEEQWHALKDFERRLERFVEARQSELDLLDQSALVARSLHITDRKWHEFQAVYGRRSAAYHKRGEHLAWLQQHMDDSSQNGFGAIRENLETLRSATSLMDYGRMHMRGSLDRLQASEFHRAIGKLDRAVPGFARALNLRARKKLQAAMANIRHTLDNPEWMSQLAQALEAAGIRAVSLDHTTIAAAIQRLSQAQEEDAAWLKNPVFRIKGLEKIQKTLHGMSGGVALELLHLSPRVERLIESLKEQSANAPAAISFRCDEIYAKTAPRFFDDLSLARLERARQRIFSLHQEASRMRESYCCFFAQVEKAFYYLACRADQLVPTERLQAANGTVHYPYDRTYIEHQAFTLALGKIDGLMNRFSRLWQEKNTTRPSGAASFRYTQKAGHG